MKLSKFNILWGYAIKIGTNLIECGLGTWELPDNATDHQRQKVVLKAMKLGMYVKHENIHDLLHDFYYKHTIVSCC